MPLFDEVRTPTLLLIKEEIWCLFGNHKSCTKHYKRVGFIQEVYCKHSMKLIKKINPEHGDKPPIKVIYQSKKWDYE